MTEWLIIALLVANALASIRIFSLQKKILAGMRFQERLRDGFKRASQVTSGDEADDFLPPSQTSVDPH